MSTKQSIGAIFLNIVFITLFVSEGAFVLTTKKLPILGKYSSTIYELTYPAHILVALSSFSIAAIGVLGFFKMNNKTKVRQILFGVAFVLFTVGYFM